MVKEVVGVDMQPVHFEHAKFRIERIDIRNATLQDTLQDAEALIHLKFTPPTRDVDGDALFELNVRAAHKVFHAARRRGVKDCIHMSTAAVYGSAVHANGDAPLK